jgi:rare lipoprotein A (peptidoglycan hydrolase)
MVDLSFQAARSLGFNHKGTERVKLERVDGAEAAQLNWPNLGRSENAPISR